MSVKAERTSSEIVAYFCPECDKLVARLIGEMKKGCGRRSRGD